jgi:hypothetical protein
MKIQIYLRILLLVLLPVFGAFAQTYKNVEIRPRTVLIGETNPFNLITTEFLRNNATPQRRTSRDVHIRQIGFNNQFISKVRSASSDIVMYQMGNQNQAYLNRNAIDIREQILQRGNNNVFYDIGRNWTLYHSGQIYQQGNNQKLLYIGSNSLSERIRVSMRGNNQTVIIRNINRR